MTEPAAPPRLSLATLPLVPEPGRPAYDPGAVRVGQVHLGLGAFHRAHQAVYTDTALARGVGGAGADGGGAGGGGAGSSDWGICAVSHRSLAVVDALAAQDGLYSVVERGPTGDPAARVIGAVRQVLPGAATAAVVARLADPAVRVVTLTITERGYPVDPGTGRLATDAADATDLAADLATLRAGRELDGLRTMLGRLLAGLAARARADAGPLSVVSCDNLAGNGGVLAGLLTDAAERVGSELVSWLAASVQCPATVVDRIVPAPQPADREAAARALGIDDAGAVATEPYRLWVVEDAFAAGRPAWEAAGALLVPDAAPYERVKLRVLNASHSALAYLGLLTGHELVARAAADPALAELCDRMLAEDVRPTLPDAPGLDPDRYAGEVLRRFRNPCLPHRLVQVAADGSRKLPQRVLGTAADRYAAGAEPRWLPLVVAAWLRCLALAGEGARARDGGRLPAVADPLADRVRAALAGPGGAAEATRLLGGVTAEQLAEPVGAWYRRLAVDGARATLEALGRTA